MKQTILKFSIAFIVGGIITFAIVTPVDRQEKAEMIKAHREVISQLQSDIMKLENDIAHTSSSLVERYSPSTGKLVMRTRSFEFKLEKKKK